MQEQQLVSKSLVKTSWLPVAVIVAAVVVVFEQSRLITLPFQLEQRQPTPSTQIQVVSPPLLLLILMSWRLAFAKFVVEEPLFEPFDLLLPPQLLLQWLSSQHVLLVLQTLPPSLEPSFVAAWGQQL